MGALGDQGTKGGLLGVIPELFRMESCSHIVPGLGKALGTIQNIVEKVRLGQLSVKTDQLVKSKSF